MKRYQSILKEFGPLTGPQRGSQSGPKDMDKLDRKLLAFQDKYLHGEPLRKIIKNMSNDKRSELYQKFIKKNWISDKDSDSFALQGYIYNILFGGK